MHQLLESLALLREQFVAQRLTLAAFQSAYQTAFAPLKAKLAERAENYQRVLDDIFARLEAGAAFTEESCSYSQADLVASLQDWETKLRARLRPTS